MSALRLLLTRRGWVLPLLALTLAVRLLVPTGFMPVTTAGAVTLQACDGMTHASAMHHGKAGKSAPVTAEMPCAFAGAGLVAVGSALPVLLAGAILFAFLLAVRAVPGLAPVSRARMRPPLRAPPLPA